VVEARRTIGAFPVLERIGSPEELVLQLPDPQGERLAVLARPTSDAIVLGSTQHLAPSDADAARSLSLPVLRRRSGGGVVVVHGLRPLWLDLYIPADDPLAQRDVARAAFVIGELWQGALTEAAQLSPERLVVHRGALVSSQFSRLVCFAGLGPGEVTIDGRKLVGLSQRRDRAGSWFFTLAYVTFDAELHGRLFPSLGPDAQRALTEELGAVASLGATAGAVEAALRSRLT
jgi:lipoate-protein ligase A